MAILCDACGREPATWFPGDDGEVYCRACFEAIVSRALRKRGMGCVHVVAKRAVTDEGYRRQWTTGANRRASTTTTP